MYLQASPDFSALRSRMVSVGPAPILPRHGSSWTPEHLSLFARCNDPVFLGYAYLERRLSRKGHIRRISVERFSVYRAAISHPARRNSPSPSLVFNDSRAIGAKVGVV